TFGISRNASTDDEVQGDSLHPNRGWKNVASEARKSALKVQKNPILAGGSPMESLVCITDDFLGLQDVGVAPTMVYYVESAIRELRGILDLEAASVGLQPITQEIESCWASTAIYTKFDSSWSVGDKTENLAGTRFSSLSDVFLGGLPRSW
ncbi:hypothetical protein WG66_002478, partial [Moniliophthora roreri]